MKMEWPSESDAEIVALRNNRRDSMFLKSTVEVDRLNCSFDVVVRNVSAGGLLADTTINLDHGDTVRVDLRRVGKVPGRIVWAESGRFGVAFDATINPQLVRQPVAVKKPPAAPPSGFGAPRSSRSVRPRKI